MKDLLPLLALLRGLLIDLSNCVQHLCWVLFHALVARRATLRKIVTSSVRSAGHLWRCYRKFRHLDEGPFVPGPATGWIIDVYKAVGFFFEVLVGGIRADRAPLGRIVRGATLAACSIYRCYRGLRRPARLTGAETA